MNRILFLLSISILIYGFISCKSLHFSKRNGKSHDKIHEKDIQAINKKLAKNIFKFEWLTFKAKVTSPYHNDNSSKEKQFMANIRMRKDSLIWISINAGLGIEAMRLILTTDSIKIIDRINKKLTISNFNYLNNFSPFPLNFNNLQALLTGNLAFHNVNSATSQIIIDNISDQQSYHLQDVHKEYGIINIWIDDKNFRVNKIAIQNETKSQRFIATYDNHQPLTDGQFFPLSNIFTMVLNQLVTTEFTLQITKIKLNEPTSFPFKMPEKYEKVF